MGNGVRVLVLEEERKAAICTTYYLVPQHDWANMTDDCRWAGSDRLDI